MNRSISKFATILLFMVLALFVVTIVLRPEGLLGAVMLGAASAGLVGAITDWFAVSALFRRIPIPGLAGSTDVVVTNRKSVEAALVRLLDEKVVSPEATRQWLSQTPLTKILFESETNKKNLKQAVDQLARTVISAIPVETIAEWVVKELPPQIKRMELGKSFRSAAEYITKDSRFDALCRSAAGMVADVLENKVIDQVTAVFLSESTKRVEKHLESKGIFRMIAAIPLVGDWLADFLTRFVARKIHEQLEERIEEFANDWVAELRTIESGGTARDDFQIKYEAARSWIKATILGIAQSDQPTKLIENLVGDVERNPSGFCRKIAEFLDTYRNELLRPENPRLAAIAEWIAGDVSTADGDHWINRLVTDGLPELLNKRSFAPVIRDGLARISDDDLRRFGAERLENDLSAIRVTGTFIGVVLGGIVHATIWIATKGN